MDSTEWTELISKLNSGITRLNLMNMKWIKNKN
jgi:hypothetical protein